MSKRTGWVVIAGAAGALLALASPPHLAMGMQASTSSPTASSAVSATPSPSPFATATLTPTTTPSPTPNPTPTLTPTATPIFPLGGLTREVFPGLDPIAVVGCVGVSILVLVAGLAILAPRRRRRRVVRPPMAVPRTPVPTAETAPLPARVPAFIPQNVPYLEAQTPAGPVRWPLDRPAMRVGRAEDNDLMVDQRLPNWETVSRYHARLSRGPDGEVMVEDLHSHNGVYVNGRRTARNLLREGWRLTLGEVEFIFHAG